MNESVEAGSIHDRTVRSEINSIQETLKLLELPIPKVNYEESLGAKPEISDTVVSRYLMASHTGCPGLAAGW